MSLSNGVRLGPYEIVSSLGRGGMGEVYRARHVKLERQVAIKVLPDSLATSRDRLNRFEREARLASSLNHPNIVTIYDVAEDDGTPFIAMELIEGETLRKIIHDGATPVERAIDLATQIADGLARAHAAGIVHRDLKPENVMVTPDGLVKILDFGLAKAVSGSTTPTPDASTSIMSAIAAVAGTPRYMSPEQIAHEELDHRSDQFAFGIILYEMLAGKRPFDGPSVSSILTAISHDTPPPLGAVTRRVPRDLQRIVRRCLEKNPNERYATTSDLAQALHGVSTARGRASLKTAAAAVIGTLLLLSAIGLWMWDRGAGGRWAETEAVPQIAAMIDNGNVFEAYRLANRAKRFAPEKKEIDQLLGRISLPLRVVTEPPGAEVSIKGYTTPDAPWEVVGTTPLQTRAPYALMRIRIQKEGFETYEGAPVGAGTFATLGRGVRLDRKGTWPTGMVPVVDAQFRGGPLRLRMPRSAALLPIASYWIDRYEVTNREFKKFVDAGGYRDAKLWRDGLPQTGVTPLWNDTMNSLRDSTGLAGPATWNLGAYREGEDDLPVGGVSWYEAAAYCRSVGKTLPTIYHWFSAVGQDQYNDILRMSNFKGEGPAPVGRFQGLGGYGTYDTAGNVKEWCWNATSDGKRYILGGAWSDPSYMFRHIESRPPIERLPTHGIRCARFDTPPGEVLFAPTDPVVEIAKPAPVSDEVFKAFRGIYSYDRKELNARVESRDDSSPHWRKEIVSFDAPYGGQRMRAILFLPRNAKPPYKTVVWFPGGDAFIFRSSETLASSYLFDFLPRSGRALVYPIYYGMYERFVQQEVTPSDERDRLVSWSKEVSRTIDYLESRTDIDRGSIAYYGFSSGAHFGSIFTAMEPRIRASIFLAGGLVGKIRTPEADPEHFAARSKVPTLMISGVDDFILPYEAQKRLYDALGTPPEHKRLVRLEGGHIPSNRLEIIRHVLEWLDRYQGPVASAGEAKAAAVPR